MRSSAATLLSVILVSAATAAPGQAYSLRNTELLRYECRQDTYCRDITLFANGTVRLREGVAGARSLLLADLEPGELAEALRQLREVDLSETESSYHSHLGDNLESCVIRLDPEGSGSIEEYTFGRLEVSTLAINQLIEIAEGLGKKTRRPEDKTRDLPLDYRPRRGDLLRRFDGQLFEVLYFSADGLEVELEGVDQPTTLVVAIIDLAEVFDSIEPPKKD